jgi:hypothetical protein
VYLYPFLRQLTTGTDEGTLLYGAARVAEGQVLYRDFFEVMGPGTIYSVAWAFKLFGATWLITRILLGLVSVSTVLLLYHLHRRLRARFEAIPAILFFAALFGPAWPAVSHHGDSTLFALLAFTVLLRWLDTQRSFLLFAAGLLAGVTTCFLQPKGLLLVFSFVAILWSRDRKSPGRLRSMALLLGGYVAVGFVVVALFGAAGAFQDFTYANIVWPLKNYSGANAVPYGAGSLDFYWHRWAATLPGAVSAPAGYLLCSMLLAPLLFVLALPALLALFATFRRSLAGAASSQHYLWAGAALWLSELHRKDITHLIYGSPLLVILFFHWYGQLKTRWSLRLRQIVATGAVALATFNFIVATYARSAIQTRRGVAYAFTADPVIDFLGSHTKPGEEIFAYPDIAIYYFLEAVKNPTRYSLLIYDLHTDSQFREAVRSLQERRVRYVLWDSTYEDPAARWIFPARWRFRPNDRLILEPYILENYELAARLNHVRVFERKDIRRLRAQSTYPRPLAPPNGK